MTEKEGFLTTKRGKRFAKFVFIGTIGWGLNFLLLFLLDMLLDLTVVKYINLKFWIFTINQGVIASLISMMVVVVFTFIMNKIWTFKGEEFHSNTFYQFFQFAIIGIVGYGIYSGIMMGVHGTLLWNQYLSMTIAFYTGLISNFIWNDIWTFNPKIIKKLKSKRMTDEDSKNQENEITGSQESY